MNPDTAVLHFNPASLQLLNICLGFIMFGVALYLEQKDFKEVFRAPKSIFVGLVAQLLLLPLLTFILVYLLQPHRSFALGMILVAACPGGNVSNFISHYAKGNAALSVSLTSIITLGSVLITPLNFQFWAQAWLRIDSQASDLSLSFGEMFQSILLLIILPIFLGLLFKHYFSSLSLKLRPWIQKISLLFFAAFILITFQSNFTIFIHYIHLIIGLVLLHNALALLLGYGLASVARLSDQDRRTISIETGIQNSGLGLILIFNYFDALGGMALIAAWWGIWHIISGLSLAWVFRKFELSASKK